MKKILLILLCLPLITLAQQTYVPDNNFEAYLEANNMGNGIANDDFVTTANISLVTNLVVEYLSISDLTGIEDFTALTDLRCGDNQLTSLDVSNNTALTFLNCKFNQLTSLDVSNNTALTSLSCIFNQITSLDVSNNTALTQLGCSSNSLTSLDVSQNTALTFLGCFSNQLTSLDVSNNTALIDFNCGDNQITSLDVSNNTALTDLACDGNQLTNFDVSNNTALTSLYSGRNQLTCLNVKNGNNNNLGFINFYSNPNLSCIEVDNPAWSTANWTNIDPNVTFSTNCNYPLGCFNINPNSVQEIPHSISIYPNPTNENITISIENFNGNIQTEVYDLIGNRLQVSNETTISLQDYARGIYLLKVAYGDRVEEVKVIKQ